MAPTISIIMPAYNAAKYLGEAAGSVISQSFPDWELLLVDDGSADDTGALCDSMACADPRIRSYHKPNGGLSDARNYGLDRARGEFVVFLDADDLLSSRFLRDTVGLARETGASLVCTGHEKFHYITRRGFETRSVARGDVVSAGAEEAVRHALYQTPLHGCGIVPDHSAWGKLYRRELWDGLRFTKGTWYEDLDIFYRVWSRCSSIVFAESPMLGYRQHDDSFLHRFTPSRLDVLDVTDRLVSLLADNRELSRAAATRRYAAHYNILTLLYENGVDDRETERRCRRVIVSERLRVLFDKSARRKDRVGALVSYGGFGLVRRIVNNSKVRPAEQASQCED